MEEAAASDEDEGHQENTNAEDDYGYGHEDDSMADPDNGQIEDGIDNLDVYYGGEDENLPMARAFFTILPSSSPLLHRCTISNLMQSVS